MAQVTKKVVKKGKGKAVRPEVQAKKSMNATISEFLLSQGVEVLDGKTVFGMTEHTMVARLEDCDVQIKLITPRLDLNGRYEELEEEEE